MKMGAGLLVEEVEVSPGPGVSPSYTWLQHGGGRKCITATTVSELWQQSFKAHGNHKCLGIRGEQGRFTFMSYKEIDCLVRCSSSILWQLKKKQKAATACIWGPKCPAWMVSFLALSKAGLACVPIDSEIPSHAADTIVQDSKPFIVFSHRDCLIQIAKTLQRNPKTVDVVVYWGEECPYYLPEMEELRNANVTVYHLSEFLDMGDVYKKMIIDHPNPNTDLMVTYTLGEQGKATAHRFTHTDFLTGIASNKLYYEARQQGLTSQDIALSSLSLDEAGNLTAELLLLHCGASIGYSTKFAATLLNDAISLQPTVILSTPDTLSDICRKVKARMSQGSILSRLTRNFLFHWGFKRKRAFLKSGLNQVNASPVFDSFVHHELGNILGGKLRMITSFGPPLSEGNSELLEVVMSCALHQLYGAPCLPSMSFFYNTGLGSKDLGSLIPLPLVSWRLECTKKSIQHESPVMRGEMVVSFQNHSETPHNCLEKGNSGSSREEHKWRHTETIAEMQGDGGLRLVNHRQSSRRISHNEKSLQFIEQIYRRSPLVRDITVHHGENGILTAEVFPDFSVMSEWANLEGLDTADKTTIDHPDIISETLERLNTIGKQAGLRGNEKLDGVTMIKWSSKVSKYDVWIDNARKLVFKHEFTRNLSRRMSSNKKVAGIDLNDLREILRELVP